MNFIEDYELESRKISTGITFEVSDELFLNDILETKETVFIDDLPF